VQTVLHVLSDDEKSRVHELPQSPLLSEHRHSIYQK